MSKTWSELLEGAEHFATLGPEDRKKEEPLRSELLHDIRKLEKKNIEGPLCEKMTHHQAHRIYHSLLTLKEPCVLVELFEKVSDPTQISHELLQLAIHDGKLTDFDRKVQFSMWARGIKEPLSKATQIAQKNPAILAEALNSFRHAPEKVYRVLQRQSTKTILGVGAIPALSDDFRRSWGRLLLAEKESDYATIAQAKLWTHGVNFDLGGLYEFAEERTEETLKLLRALPEGLDYDILTAHWRNSHTQKKSGKANGTHREKEIIPPLLRILITRDETPDDYKQKLANLFFADRNLPEKARTQATLWQQGYFVTVEEMLYSLRNGQLRPLTGLIRKNPKLAYVFLEENSKTDEILGALEPKEAVILAKAVADDTKKPAEVRAAHRELWIKKLFEANEPKAAFDAMVEYDEKKREELYAHGKNVMMGEFNADHHERFYTEYIARGGKMRPDYPEVTIRVIHSRLATRNYLGSVEACLDLKEVEEQKACALMKETIQLIGRDKNMAVLPKLVDFLESRVPAGGEVWNLMIKEHISHAASSERVNDVVRWGLKFVAYNDGKPDAQAMEEKVLRTVEGLEVGCPHRRKVAEWVEGWCNGLPENTGTQKAMAWAVRELAEEKLSRELGGGVISDAAAEGLGRLYFKLSLNPKANCEEAGEIIEKKAKEAVCRSSANLGELGNRLESMDKIQRAMLGAGDNLNIHILALPLRKMVQKGRTAMDGFLAGL